MTLKPYAPVATLVGAELALLEPRARRELLVSLAEHAATRVVPGGRRVVSVSLATELIARLCCTFRCSSDARTLQSLAACLAREAELLRFAARVAHAREAENAARKRRRGVVVLRLDEHRGDRGTP